MGDGRQKSERKKNRADARGDRDDSSVNALKKNWREREREKKMRKNYTESADLLAYREVRIYINEEKRLVNDKEEKRRVKIRRIEEKLLDQL